MSQIAVDLESLPILSNPGRIAILTSKWYPEIIGQLTGTCEKVLRSKGFNQIDIHQLPGSLEMPLAAADLFANDDNIEAIICFGVIVKGETLHFEMISEECMRGLGQVMQTYRKPVIVEILPVFKIEDAHARAADDEFNKGNEAAAAAIEMIAWRRRING